MNTLIYIAGPMEGIPGCNFDEFDAAAKRLRDKGFCVINPAEIERSRMNGRDILPIDEVRQIMDEEIEIIRRCDTIYLLRGWENSRGAKRELHTALEHRLQIMLESENENR